MIECRNICVSAAGKLLLDEVSFEVERAKMNAVIGPNGAGKSTLLKTLLGLIEPERGVVTVNTLPLKEWNSTELASIRAYMAQSSSIQLNLPVYEYLSLARLHCIESQTKSDNAVERVIHKLDIHHLATQSIDKLSGGEWQRVDLARAWCQIIKPNGFDNTLLILDEPGSALDIHQTKRLYTHLQEYTNEGGTAIIVEHDINMAARFCNTITMLKNGSVIHSGSTSDVFNRVNINQCFGVDGQLIEDNRDGRLTFML